MTNKVSKTLALMLATGVVLGGCSNGGSGGGSSAGGDGNEINDLVIPKLATRELETFNILYSQRNEDFENLTNLVDGLLEHDSKGNLVPALATEWGTEDNGVTWTFKLRDGVKWVDMNQNEKADCVAQDFATGLEWVLNYHKNQSSNTSMPIDMIKGAEEYYEYTKSLPEAEAKALTAGEGSKFLEMVGIATPDDHTVVYTCRTAKPYFDTLATYASLYPMSQAMVDELGGADAVAAMNNENMWYNGCYTMTEYIQDNEKIFTKNDKYWDTESQRFDTVTFKMVESNDVAYQLFESGDVDYVDLTESNVKTISGDKNHKFHNYMVDALPLKFSFQFHWNYNKNKEDGKPDVNWNTAIANESFRKSLYYGLDLTNYLKRFNAIDPFKVENNYYTMKGLVSTSDGKDYVKLVHDKLKLGESDGNTPIRLDAAKGNEYKEKAMQELSAQGVTFPVGIDYYISAKSQTALDSANVLKNAIESSLGNDYVQLNIKTFVSSLSKEVATPRVASFIGSGWGADYGDPLNYLAQLIVDDDNAYYATHYENINDVQETPATKELIAQFKEYTALVEKADAITDDLDKRYDAFAEAEAYLIDHCLVLPTNYDMGYCLTKFNIHDKMQAPYGICNDKLKNIRSSADGYTVDDMKAILAE